MTAEKDNLTELFERYAPFFAWLHFHNCIKFAPPGFERSLVNGKLRFYVRKKIPPSQLKDDWNVLHQVYLEHRDEFVNVDPQNTRIPSTIEGYPTEVREKLSA